MWRLIIIIAASTSVFYILMQILLHLSDVAIVASSNDCVKRRSTTSGDEGHYCVCNANQCDQTPDIVKPLNEAEYVLITSNKNGLRFRVLYGVFKNHEPNSKSNKLNGIRQLLRKITSTTRIFRGNKKKFINLSPGKIIVNQTDTYQEIFGFGGAVTDSAAMNILNLTQKASDNLLKSYFGPHGINYTFIRTPMGGTDFSTRPYSYAMRDNDSTLSYFTLQMEDNVYKIPVIKRAQELKKNTIKLLTVPWTASPWMKTKYTWTYDGKLHPEYRQVWANYFVKYLEAYRNVSLEFWGLSSQNEPLGYIYIPFDNFNAMAWTAEEERDWIIEYLSPTLKRNGFGHIKIFIMEENRLALPDWPKIIFEDKRARNVTSGIATHFYFDTVILARNLNEIKRLYPEKSIINTEACTGVFEDQKVILGSWRRGEIYARSIIENMLNWASSWIDWNIALDMTGGPSWIGHAVDSPIIVNSVADEFYKQPMFYVLGHFSKYVPPNSVRIGTTMENTKGIEHVAFSTPDGGVVLVILNLNEEKKVILIEDPQKGTTRLTVLAKSINTMKYWK